MVIAEQQLREEVYAMALQKLILEERIKSMEPHIAVLKRELEQRTPITQ